MSRLTMAVLVLGLLLLPACGGGTGDSAATTTIVQGPLTIALPFIPTAIGESVTVGFRNLSTETATVSVTAYLPTGVAYAPATPVTIAPAGGAQWPLALFTGGLQLGGWLYVDTRDTTVLDASGEPTETASSGFVVAYMQRADAARDTDGAIGAAFRDDLAFASLIPTTTAFQIVNRSYDPAGGGSTPKALSVVVTQYDAFGAVPFPPTTVVVPAHGSAAFLPLVSTGRVEVVPAAAPGAAVIRFAVATIEAGPPVFIEARQAKVRRLTQQRFVAFDLEFGVDFPGNEYDFAVVATNASDLGDDETVVIESIYSSDGQPILTQPRVVGLDDKRTKLLATTTLDSQGLDNTEVSPFADIFGDVSSATGLDVFTLVLSVPVGVDVSARAFDSFNSFYRILPGRKLTTDVAVCGVQVPTTTTTSVTNLVSLMNPRTGDLFVNVRALTPGGTVYLLDSITVGPYGRIDWSPDGMTFTEDPSDVTAPPVPFVSFRFTGQGGMFFNARRERRDIQDLIRSVVPHPVRDLSAD